jgi:hypothetical protein
MKTITTTAILSLAVAAVATAEPAEENLNDRLPERSGNDYGFRDWKVSDADFKIVKDRLVRDGVSPELVDQYRPFLNSADRRDANEGSWQKRYFKPGYPDGLGNVELAKLGYLDVTAAPFNVKPDDGRDDTLVLQDAIDFARDHQLVTYLPAGEYNVSDTLHLAQGTTRMADGKISTTDMYGVYVVGEKTNDGKRARIVLADGSFPNADSTRPLIYVQRVGEPKTGRKISRNSNTVNYGNLVHGLELVLGDNPGAWGISFQAAEGSTMQDLVIDARGANGGINGFPGSGGGTFDITVIGGKVGVQSDEFPGSDGVDFEGATHTQPGPTIAGMTLIDQELYAIAHENRGNLVAVGITIETEKNGPVIRTREHWWGDPYGSSLALIDATIEYKSASPDNTVLDAGRSVWLEDVYVKNAAHIGESRFPAASGQPWTHVKALGIAKELWTEPRTAKVKQEDGSTKEVTVDVDERVYVDGQPIGDYLYESTGVSQPPADVATRHQMGDVLPVMDDAQNIKDHGAIGDGTADDTAAIRKAIRAAGPGGTVFVPKGVFVTTDTLDLLPNQTLIGVHHKLSNIVGAEDDKRGRFGKDDDPTTGEPVIRTVDAADDETVIGMIGIRHARSMGSHDPRPIGIYALEWRSGQGKVFGVEAKAELNTNWWERQVLRLHLNADDAKLDEYYQSDELGKLDPRVGWEIPHPEGKGGYGSGPGPDGSYPISPISHPLVQVRGNGGGQWFQFWNHGYDPVTSDYRILLVEDTTNRFEVYHLHGQHKRSDAQFEVRRAKNVHFYGSKQEVHDTFLRIVDSDGIYVYGYAGIGGPFKKGDAIYEIENSTNVLITTPGDEPILNSAGYGLSSPRSRLWRPFVGDFHLATDDATGSTPPAARPVAYMLGEPLEQ